MKKTEASHAAAIQAIEQECKKLKWGKTSGELTDV